MSDLSQAEKQALIRAALDARTRAVAPVQPLCGGGRPCAASTARCSPRCNIENAAFTPTSCAERTALFNGCQPGGSPASPTLRWWGAKMGEVNKLVTAPLRRMPPGPV